MEAEGSWRRGAAGGGGQRARNYRCALRRLPSIVLWRTSEKMELATTNVVQTKAVNAQNDCCSQSQVRVARIQCE